MKVTENLSFEYLMNIYPSDNIEGILLMSHEECSFVDLLHLPDSLICKLDKLGKFNSRAIAEQLNNEINVTILF